MKKLKIKDIPHLINPMWKSIHLSIHLLTNPAGAGPRGKDRIHPWQIISWSQGSKQTHTLRSMHSANLFIFIYIYFISVWSYWNKLYFPKTKERKKREKKKQTNKKEPNYIWDRNSVATAHMHLPLIHNAELNRPRCDSVTGNSILW